MTQPSDESDVASLLAFEPMSLTFLVIAYNEEDGLVHSVEDCLDWMRTDRRCAQVLILDDASTDGTPQVADALQARYPGVVRVFHQPTNKGQFHNMSTGIRMATTRFFTIVPGDNQFDMSGFRLFAPHVGQYDVIFGFPNNESIRGRGRVLASHAWRFYLLALFGFPVTYLGGIVVAPVELVRRFEVESEHFLGWYETALQLCLCGATYLQLPFEMRERAGGETKSVAPLRNLTDVARMARLWRRIKAEGLVGEGVRNQKIRQAYQDYRASFGDD